MKVITKNLLYFSASLVVLTIIFRYFLSSMLQDRLFSNIWIIAVVYGVVVFIMGAIFGRRDRIHLPLYDIGFRFHLATYIICNTIAELWYLAGMQSDYENIRGVHLTILFWGMGLLLHFIIYLITRRNAIKGIN